MEPYSMLASFKSRSNRARANSHDCPTSYGSSSYEEINPSTYTDLEMSSGDLPDRDRSARPVWLCKAENLNFLSVSMSRNRFTKPLHMLQTPSYSRTGLVSWEKTALAIPGSFSASSTYSRAGDCCAVRGRDAGRWSASTPCLARRGAMLKPAPDVMSIREMNPYNTRRRSPAAERATAETGVCMQDPWSKSYRSLKTESTRVHTTGYEKTPRGACCCCLTTLRCMARFN